MRRCTAPTVDRTGRAFGHVCRCDATCLRADDGIGGARRSATSWRAPVCVRSACFIEQAWACVCACERGCLGHLTVCANALCAEIYRIIMRGRGTHARTHRRDPRLLLEPIDGLLPPVLRVLVVVRSAPAGDWLLSAPTRISTISTLLSQGYSPVF